MNATLPELLTRIDRKADEDHALIKALISATRAQFSANGDDDQWTPLPNANLKCPKTGEGRSRINMFRKQGLVRSKSVHGRVYYSALDLNNIKNGRVEA